MEVYVFGNEHVGEDKGAIEVARGLEGTVEGVSFVYVGPNEDLVSSREIRSGNFVASGFLKNPPTLGSGA